MNCSAKLILAEQFLISFLNVWKTFVKNCEKKWESYQKVA